MAGDSRQKEYESRARILSCKDLWKVGPASGYPCCLVAFLLGDRPVLLL